MPVPRDAALYTSCPDSHDNISTDVCRDMAGLALRGARLTEDKPQFRTPSA